jgi:uncharacterized OsmC-like protein
MTSKITYLGHLRTSSVHIQSGTEILSDAPVDNHGKGEAFSPTDLVANALGSCVLTIMGIKAQDLNIDISGTTAEVTKTMQLEPRRIAKIEINVTFIKFQDEKTKKILEKAAMTCPVINSLHPDLEKIISFNWN